MKSVESTLVVVCFFLTGCQYDPFAGDLTTKEPALKDVVGTYYFEKQTVRDNDGLTSETKPAIDLFGDGTYKLMNVPDLTGKRDSADKKPISAEGQWEIVTVGGVDNGWGHTKPNWGITLTSVTESLSTIGFMGDAPPYKLIITYGDPDAGAVMIFAKK